MPDATKLGLSFDCNFQVNAGILGLARFRLVGPHDRDKDGDPEVSLHVDLPGEAFDKVLIVELPWRALALSPAVIAKTALESAPDFPLRKKIIEQLETVVGP